MNDLTITEKDKINKWINSFNFPTAPCVEESESIAIVEEIKEKFNNALTESIKLCKLPF